MYFEIYGAKNQVASQITFATLKKLLALEVRLFTTARAEKVLAELVKTFKNGEFDSYRLPKE